MAKRRNNGAQPKGDVREMTQEWKQLVLLALDQRGKSIPWLAEQVGLSRSGGYKIFATREDGSMVQRGCAEVPQICTLLDLPPPLVAAPPEPETRDAKIQELLTHAPDSLKDAVIEILTRLQK